METRKFQILHKLASSLWHDEKTFRIRLILGASLIFMTAGMNLALPWCLKAIVDTLSVGHKFNYLTLLLLSYGLIWILAQMLIAIRQIIIYRVFERGVYKLGMEVFEKLLSLPSSYHVHRSTGGLLNAIERAQAAFPDVLFGLMFIVIPMIVEIVIATAFLSYYYESKYISVLFVLFVSYFIFTWSSISWIVDAQRIGNKEDKKVSSFIADILMNIEYIHYQDYYQTALKECQKNMAMREDAITKKMVRIDSIYLGQIGIAGIGFTILTMLVGHGVTNGELVVSDFVLFNGYLIQFLVPLNVIGTSVLRKIREGLTRMEDVMDIISLPIPNTDMADAKSLPGNNPVSIEFKNVSFKYPDTNHYVLEDVNLQIYPGKTVALVGANGSGKSTIVKLLYRLYDPLNGDILLNKKSIKNYSLSSLRSHIGIVPQETLLLNDTIYANLTMNSKIPIESDLFQQVMKEAKIADWVRGLPEGYNTPIGERGVKLSGGERQRIALARVLLRNPQIIIMDEATSALDERTENEIFMQLKTRFSHISKLIITHNSKNLSFADAIIALK